MDEHKSRNQGYRHGLAVLDESEVIQIYKSKSSVRALAKRFNISPSTVHNIKTKKAWSHLTNEIDNATTDKP